MGHRGRLRADHRMWLTDRGHLIVNPGWAGVGEIAPDPIQEFMNVTFPKVVVKNQKDLAFIRLSSSPWTDRVVIHSSELVM